MLVDISEQKTLERELAKSQEQYHALANNLQVALSSMSDGIFIIDGELNYVAFNQRYVDLLGFPDGLVREGGAVAEVTEFAAKRGDYGNQFEGDIDDIVSGRLKQLSSDKAYVIENVTPTGRIVEYRGSPIDGGGYVSIMHDVTERKKAEEALEQAHETIKMQRDRMEDELNVGREIQMSMIPLNFPPFPDHDEFSIFAALEPAREVGGDFYDFFFVDDDRLCLCIGDVSGKGVPSALFMAVTKTLIKSRAMDDTSTAGILTHVNAELAADNKSSMFVTVFLAILNFKTGELVYTNAGHNPPYLRRKGGSLRRLDVRHGPVVGALPGLAYRQDSATVSAGDMLFMYTDGVTEERNRAGELFSERKLATLLGSQGTASVESAVQATVAAVREFRGAGDQEDDVTVLAVQFQGSSMADPNAVFRVTAQNDLSEIAMVVGKFQEFASKRGLPLELGRRISVIFDDLLNNVISYAFPDGEGHEIEIRTELADNRLTVTISDDGIPFNPLGAGVPDTSLPLESRAIGGLGIHLVRNLVDEVSYQRRIGRNVLTLVKRIDANDGTS